MKELINQLSLLHQHIKGTNCPRDKIFNIKIIATKTGELWDINQRSLFEFLLKHTTWQPLTESFFDYLAKQSPGVITEILIITDNVAQADRRHLEDYLAKYNAV